MKKKLLALGMVAALGTTAVVGGTLAYFTDIDAETNTFTVGNVNIELIESQLHRTNAGIANDVTESDNILWSDVDMEGSGKVTYEDGSEYWDGAYFTDEQIKTDAENYHSEYLANADIAPGTGYHKMPYVINTGKNDAYIRIRVMIPSGLNDLLDSSMFTSSALDDEFTAELGTNYGGVETTYDGKNYDVYTFTRVNPLASGEMTFWNVWGTITMDTDVTNEDITRAVKEGWISGDTGEFNVLVQADAIQADSFDNATDAWAAYDNK